MKEFITEEEVKELQSVKSAKAIADAINQLITKMTTQKQPKPLPEFEPFDVERARAGEDVWYIDSTKAKQYFVFDNGYIAIVWSEENQGGMYTKNEYELLLHKRKAKPIEFESLLDERGVWNKPYDFDTVELIGTIDGKDFMKATKGKATAYYLGKFNDGTLK